MFHTTSIVPSSTNPATVRVSSGKTYACLRLTSDGNEFTLHVTNETTALALAAILSADPSFERDADSDNLYTPKQDA